MTLGLGWKPDRFDARDRSSIGVFGAPLVEFEPASLLRYRVNALYQNGFSACVGYALARALHMSMLIADEAAGRTVYSAMPSPGFLYYNGRRAETAEARFFGGADVKVRDHGTQPRLMMQAARVAGYCREVDYPFEAMSEDIRNFPDDNRKPPPAAYMAAADQRNLRYSRVYQTGEARKLEVARLFKAKVPIIYGTRTDHAMMRNQGEPIQDIDLANDLGGHMLAGLEAREDGLLFDNWWGPGWGSAGMGLVTWEVFCNPDIVSDVYAIETTLPFSSEPA